MKLTIDQMLDRAATIAVRAHDGQLRKDGSSYIAHPIRVAMRQSDDTAKVVSLLHDVPEDSPITLEELREEGFTNDVIFALDAVTKRKGETYAAFIDRIVAAGPLAITVKISDIHDNLSDQSALDPEEAAFFKTRYTKALRTLHDGMKQYE